MYLDLEFESRTNGEFQSSLQKQLKNLAHFNKLATANQSFVPRYQQALMDFATFCNFNLVFLTPYFWPRYPKDEPLNFADFPFAFQMFEFQMGGFMVFRGSRQIAKSTSFCCRQQLNARFLPGFKSLYLAPRNQQLETYQNKMREIEHAMSGFNKKRDPDLRKNLGYKEFLNGSTIEMVYVLTTASPVRGKSADELLYDETQDFDPDLEIEVAEIQSASPFPVTIYAGTSLDTNTMLEKKWSDSSQGLWLMKCDHCNHYNIPLPEHKVLDMIQPNGPSCVKCSRPVNVRDGQFVHSYPNLVSAGRKGFHIPQIIVPSVVNNPIRWARIYENKLKHGGSRKFLQEILGIAVEEGEREITIKNLRDICVLGRDIEALHRKAKENRYDFVVSGADWGGSDYIPAQHIKISTTVHAILGVTSDRKLDILHLRRYSGMNYDDIVGDMLRNHENLRGRFMASDFGVGAVYNSKIREKIPPEKHLIFGYVGPASDLVAEPKGAHIYNQWSLNKTESISLTYEAVRTQRIRCFAWEYAEEYLSDFLNLFRAPGEKSSSGQGSGATTFIYRSHPSKPNDTLMAINYGYMLAKILMREPMFADMSVKLRLEQTLQSDMNYMHSGMSAISG
jgi:hypothetical protein